MAGPRPGAGHSLRDSRSFPRLRWRAPRNLLTRRRRGVASATRRRSTKDIERAAEIVATTQQVYGAPSSFFGPFSGTASYGVCLDQTLRRRTSPRIERSGAAPNPRRRRSRRCRGGDCRGPADLTVLAQRTDSTPDAQRGDFDCSSRWLSERAPCCSREGFRAQPCSSLPAPTRPEAELTLVATSRHNPGRATR